MQILLLLIIVKLNFPRLLIFRISHLIYSFFNNGKVVILFWQIFILFNFIFAERLISDFLKNLKFDYLPEYLFIWYLFQLEFRLSLIR